MTATSHAPHPASAPDQREDHREEQRRRILVAAATCFSRDGFHGTSMQRICAAAGMSPGALYRYFPSKESLIGALIEGERADRARILDALRGATSLRSGIRDALALLLDPTSSVPCSALGPEIMAEAIRNERLRDAIEPVEAETRGLVLEALREAQARGEIDDALDLDLVNKLLTAMGDGLIFNMLRYPDWGLDGRTDEIAGLIGRMLAPRREDRA